MALASGKSLRWVADPLGHSSPMLTLKTYAHSMQDEETDLCFVDFTALSAPNGPIRPLTKTGPKRNSPTPQKHWWS
jgi:hypothetical protein